MAARVINLGPRDSRTFPKVQSHKADAHALGESDRAIVCAEQRVVQEG